MSTDLGLDDSLITFDRDPALMDGCGVLTTADGRQIYRFGMTAGEFCEWALDMGLEEGFVTGLRMCPALHERVQQTMAALGIEPQRIH